MTVIATASNPQFPASWADIDRPDATYTVDTLRDLKVTYPNADLFFTAGIDVLQRIVAWRDWEETFDAAMFVDVTRPGAHLHAEDLEGIDALRLHLVKISVMAVFSIDRRKRVEAGRPVRYLMPDGVVQYIAKYGLYQSSEGTVGSVRPAPVNSTSEDVVPVDAAPVDAKSDTTN